VNIQLCDEQLGIGPCEICERNRRMGIHERKELRSNIMPAFDIGDRIIRYDRPYDKTVYMVWEQRGLYVLASKIQDGVCHVFHVATIRHEA
jgi:hypothetical protein